MINEWKTNEIIISTTYIWRIGKMDTPKYQIQMQHPLFRISLSPNIFQIPHDFTKIRRAANSYSKSKSLLISPGLATDLDFLSGANTRICEFAFESHWERAIDFSRSERTLCVIICKRERERLRIFWILLLLAFFFLNKFCFILH